MWNRLIESLRLGLLLSNWQSSSASIANQPYSTPTSSRETSLPIYLPSQLMHHCAFLIAICSLGFPSHCLIGPPCLLVFDLTWLKSLRCETQIAHADRGSALLSNTLQLVCLFVFLPSSHNSSTDQCLLNALTIWGDQSISAYVYRFVSYLSWCIVARPLITNQKAWFSAATDKLGLVFLFPVACLTEMAKRNSLGSARPVSWLLTLVMFPVQPSPYLCTRLLGSR